MNYKPFTLQAEVRAGRLPGSSTGAVKASISSAGSMAVRPMMESACMSAVSSLCVFLMT